MPEDNRYAAPLAAFTQPTPPTKEQLQSAHRALNRARLSFAVGIGGYFGIGFVRLEWTPAALIVMLVCLVLAHVFLGSAAARSGRSWVVYALLPVLVPGLGGLISFGVLRSKVPYIDV